MEAVSSKESKRAIQGLEEEREAVKRLINAELKHTLDEELRKAAQEVQEEQRKAIRQIIDDQRAAIRQVVEEEKRTIWERADEFKESIINLDV